MIGLFIGILLYNFCPKGFIAATKKGAAFSSKYLLKLGIILAGGTLSFKALLGVGLSALPLIVVNICVSFAVALLAGRWLRVSSKGAFLVGGGTAICGGTAIATLAPIIDADEQDMAYAMTAIFLFDIFAALMWPYAARAMHLTAAQYGILGGLAISDTSSVTAAGETFNTIMGTAAETAVGGEIMTACAMAVVVKLTRTVMLVVVALVAVLVNLRGSKAAEGEASVSAGRRVLKALPLFVLGFLAMAVLNALVDFSMLSIGSLKLSKLLSVAYKFFISAALVGVGYKIELRDLFTKGARPVLLGGCTWLAVAAVTLTATLLFY